MVYGLILDVKICIALFDQDVWIKFVMLDDEFYHYAYRKEGIKMFIDTFTRIDKGETFLFGKLHSINDQPSNVFDYYKYWYYAGENHRENDLPAIITELGSRHWYKYGNRHRENDLPAITYRDGESHWFYNGKEHRDNDLPAIIQNNGNRYWYQYGQRKRINDLPVIMHAGDVESI